MIRTQVQLPEEVYHQLKRKAFEAHISFSEMVRRMITQVLNPPHRSSGAVRKAKSIVGMMASGHSDISKNHDQYLAENFR